MNYCAVFLVFVIYLITVVDLQRSSNTIKTDDKKFHPNNLTSLIDQLRCPTGWTQLNLSCYMLSEYVSTVAQANHTCDLLHLNTSRLIYIQQSIELIYAAHVIIKNNLNNLLIQVAPDFMKVAKNINMLSANNNNTRWNNFEKEILENYKRKTGSSRKLLRIQRFTDEHFQKISSFRKLCDEFRWNVIDENSTVLLLTVEFNSNLTVCSLNNINMKVAYTHLCEYLLDRCVNNNKCGKNGHCINTQISFKCVCSFLYEGDYCEETSSKIVQLLIAIPIAIVWLILIHLPILNYLWDLIELLISWCINKKKKDEQSENITNQQITSITNRDRSSTDIELTPLNPPTQIPSIIDNQQNLSTSNVSCRLITVCILTASITIILIVCSYYRHTKIFQKISTNASTPILIINDYDDMSNQYAQKTIFQRMDIVFFVGSILMSICLIMCNKKTQSDDEYHSTIIKPIEPIKPFYITDRYKTAVIITIQIFEILEALDETKLDIQYATAYGVIYKFLTRMINVLFNIFRYSPILASLQSECSLIRCCILVYFILHLIYMTIRNNSYLWLFISLWKLTDIYKSLHFWSFSYRVVKNTLYYCLNIYICKELFMRASYICNNALPRRKINEYSFQENVIRTLVEKAHGIATPGGNNVAQNDNINNLIEILDDSLNENTTFLPNQNNIPTNENVNENKCWSTIQNFILNKYQDLRNRVTGIYTREKDFRYTTIVICTYTIEYIILIHLTFKLVFIYTTDNTIYMIYFIDIIKRILNIEIEEQSFPIEVVVSAVFVTTFFFVQLLHSMQNYKNSVRKLYSTDYSESEEFSAIKNNKIIKRSVQYPAYFLRYLLGGYIICFHSFLFIIIGGKVIITHLSSFKWTIVSIFTIIIMYAFHELLNKTLNKLFLNNQSQDQIDDISQSQRQSHPNFFSRCRRYIDCSKCYSILLYLYLILASFTSVTSSILRLLASICVNILFLPRIDYSIYPKPLQKYDSAHKAFRCFIRWELVYTFPFILQFSRSVQPVNTNQDTQNTVRAPSDQNQSNMQSIIERRQSEESESRTESIQDANDLIESNTENNNSTDRTQSNEFDIICAPVIDI